MQALDRPDRQPKPSAPAWLPWRIVLAAALISACTPEIEAPASIRPVRTVVAAAAPAVHQEEFSGDIRARIESRLAFQVGGKIVAREVDVGAVVKPGQILARLDPQDIRLQQQQSVAALRAAQSSRELAYAEMKRYEDLRIKGFVSQAVLDNKIALYQTAHAELDQAKAALKTQSNRTGYTTLRADRAGVVTAVDAEAGQVVAPGMTVIRLAEAGEKEAVIGVPEDRILSLRNALDIEVRTWANPNQTMKGIVREIAPVADSVTRTYLARIAIPDAPPTLLLGMTAVVTVRQANPVAALRLPMTSLFERDSITQVWIVEDGAVRAVPVQIAGAVGGDVLVASGVAPGQTVVTAGANLLEQGQKVSILRHQSLGNQSIAHQPGVARAGDVMPTGSSR